MANSACPTPNNAWATWSAITRDFGSKISDVNTNELEMAPIDPAPFIARSKKSNQ